ncbi:MAG: polymer-forming cytoskeletal protein [Nitrospirae bacterium]|nr:polymer-forming cytoskeletal protein [Nitrospirota bacterium]
MWDRKQDKKNPGEDGQDEATDLTTNLTTEDTKDIIAFVGKGVEFKGIISYNGTVRIDGNLIGEIHTDGVLLVGEEAVIQAKITAGAIICKGRITGDIVATERIKLRAPAVVKGSIKTPIISIEDGVLFNGDLEMTHAVHELNRETTLRPVGMIAQQDVKRSNG